MKNVSVAIAHGEFKLWKHVLLNRVIFGDASCMSLKTHYQWTESAMHARSLLLGDAAPIRQREQMCIASQ